MELRNYQKRAISFIKRRNGKALIGLDMGLGKTFTALSYYQQSEETTCLIICPAAVKLQWGQEIKKMSCKYKVAFAETQKPFILEKTDFIIINYDIVHYWKNYLSTLNIKMLICDEIHYLSSGKSKRTKAVLELSKNIYHRIGLTGTPLTNNKPMNLFYILKILNPGVFPNYKVFGETFCKQINKFAPRGFDYQGMKNEELLNRILTKQIMFRRTKQQCLKELPKLNKMIVPVTIDNLNEYTAAKDDMTSWLLKYKGKEMPVVNAMNKIEYLKQIVLKGKMNDCFKWIDNFITSEEKLVLFTTHIKTVELLKEKYPDSVTIDGSTKDKEAEKNKFIKNKNIQILIGNIASAGTGIDGIQHVCSNCCFVELDWSPHLLDQAESRLHRSGQTDSVNSYYLIAHSTIETYVYEKINNKNKDIDSIIKKPEMLLNMLRG